jgi:hypothetical protein
MARLHCIYGELEESGRSGKGMFVGFTLMAFGRMEWDFELLN